MPHMYKFSFIHPFIHSSQHGRRKGLLGEFKHVDAGRNEKGAGGGGGLRGRTRKGQGEG